MHAIEAGYPEVVARLTSGSYKRAGKSLVFSCPLKERHKHGDRNPSCTLFLGYRCGELMARCFGCGAGWADLKAWAGLPAALWFPESERKGVRRTMSRTVARYVYRHPDGSEYGTKLRLEPKSFLWERPVPADIRLLCGIPEEVQALICGPRSMDAGLYAERTDKRGVRRFQQCEATQAGGVLIPAAGKCPLFLSETLPGANKDAAVLVCEGEKDTLTARNLLGCLAVCAPHGANTWHPEYARQLAGRRVVLVPHHDGPGLAFMERVAGSLLAGGVREIRILRPECRGWELAEGEDLTDWAARPHAAARQKFAGIVGRLPAWTTRED